jgi:A118 family predicted phage portal protein
MILGRFRRQPNVYPTSERIEVWRTIYRGNPDWLDYEYATLQGTKHKRRRLSMQPAQMVVSEMSGLMFSEKPEIMADESMLEMLERSGWNIQASAFVERMLALGGAALKLYSDKNKLMIDYVPADRFIPVSWDARGITEADFLDRRVIKEKTYVRIESHRRTQGGYNITNTAYELLDGGMMVPASLALVPDWPQQDSFIPIDRPTFAYIKPPLANNIEDDSPLGISVFANCMDTLQALDIAFDALQSEIVLGRKRIIVPASAVRQVIDPETGRALRYFDPSDEIYQAFSTDDREQLKISDTSIELRIDDIRNAIQTLLDILSIQMGLSAGYLTFDGQRGMVTATQVISENSKTFKTIKAIENNIGCGLVQILEVARALAPAFSMPVTKDEYAVVWNDSIAEDRTADAAYWQGRYTAGTVTLARVIMELDKVDEAESRRIAEGIKAEKKTIDVGSMFGGME